MRSRSEKTQPGNPHGLTTKQHVFPVASINRFVQDGGVDLFDLKRQKRRRAGARDPIFCADRAWSHGAEAGFMKDIEDAFQALVEEILSGRTAAFDRKQTVVITEFYGLCQARAGRRHLPYQHTSPDKVSAATAHRTLDQLEFLEKHNIIGTRPDGSFALRDFVPSIILQDIDRISEELEGKSWGVIRSVTSEFCIPDILSRGIVPITPKAVLALGIPSDFITEESVNLINRTVSASGREYLFARDLDACPGIPRII